MPELPDIEVYRHAIERRLRTEKTGARLQAIRLANPFLLRTVEPPIDAFVGLEFIAARRIGKRVVLEFEDAHFAVIHLMIAGRFHWQADKPPLKSKRESASFDFESGSLLLTEAGTKKRASLHLVRGEAELEAHDPGGIEVVELPLDGFAARLRARNHTLKRALTDPRIFAGIGNAYSDEILHRARLSPYKWTTRLEDDEMSRLHAAVGAVLEEWCKRLADEAGNGFPAKVTAFREEMAVHGKYGQPCPVCGAKVQRIRYASNEANYCAACQTEGKLLADRALSKLLKGDWPTSDEALESLKERLRES